MKDYNNQIRVPKRVERDVCQACSMADYKKILSLLDKNPSIKIDGLSEAIKNSMQYKRFLVANKLQYRKGELQKEKDILHGKDGKSGLFGVLLNRVSVQ